MQVQVWRHRALRGADKLPESPHAPSKDLLEALNKTYSTDAHVTPYLIVDSTGAVIRKQWRLRKAALGPIREAGHDVVVPTIWIDVDAHDIPREHIEPWFDAQLEAVEALPWRPMWYRSRDLITPKFGYWRDHAKNIGVMA